MSALATASTQEDLQLALPKAQMQLEGRPMCDYAFAMSDQGPRYWPLDADLLPLSNSPLSVYNFGVWLYNYQRPRVPASTWEECLALLPPAVSGHMLLHLWKQETDPVKADMMYMTGFLAIAGIKPPTEYIRNEDFASKPVSGFKHTCLADSLIVLGHGVKVFQDGPFNIQDADDALAEWNLALEHVTSPVAGDSILHFTDHFTSLEISDNLIRWKVRHWEIQLQDAELRDLLAVRGVTLHHISPKPEDESVSFEVKNVSGGGAEPGIALSRFPKGIVAMVYGYIPQSQSRDKRHFEATFSGARGTQAIPAMQILADPTILWNVQSFLGMQRSFMLARSTHLTVPGHIYIRALGLNGGRLCQGHAHHSWNVRRLQRFFGNHLALDPKGIGLLLRGTQARLQGRRTIGSQVTGMQTSITLFGYVPSCMWCGKTANLKRCGGCLTAVYCSEACSRRDWAIHRLSCERG